MVKTFLDEINAQLEQFPSESDVGRARKRVKRLKEITERCMELPTRSYIQSGLHNALAHVSGIVFEGAIRDMKQAFPEKARISQMSCSFNEHVLNNNKPHTALRTAHLIRMILHFDEVNKRNPHLIHLTPTINDVDELHGIGSSTLSELTSFIEDAEFNPLVQQFVELAETGKVSETVVDTLVTTAVRLTQTWAQTSPLFERDAHRVSAADLVRVLVSLTTGGSMMSRGAGETKEEKSTQPEIAIIRQQSDVSRGLGASLTRAWNVLRRVPRTLYLLQVIGFIGAAFITTSVPRSDDLAIQDDRITSELRKFSSVDVQQIEERGLDPDSDVLPVDAFDLIVEPTGAFMQQLYPEESSGVFGGRLLDLRSEATQRAAEYFTANMGFELKNLVKDVEFSTTVRQLERIRIDRLALLSERPRENEPGVVWEDFPRPKALEVLDPSESFAQIGETIPYVKKQIDYRTDRRFDLPRVLTIDRPQYAKEQMTAFYRQLAKPPSQRWRTTVPMTGAAQTIAHLAPVLKTTGLMNTSNRTSTVVLFSEYPFEEQSSLPPDVQFVNVTDPSSGETVLYAALSRDSPVFLRIIADRLPFVTAASAEDIARGLRDIDRMKINERSIANTLLKKNAWDRGFNLPNSALFPEPQRTSVIKTAIDTFTPNSEFVSPHSALRSTLIRILSEDGLFERLGVTFDTLNLVNKAGRVDRGTFMGAPAYPTIPGFIRVFNAVSLPIRPTEFMNAMFDQEAAELALYRFSDRLARELLEDGGFVTGFTIALKRAQEYYGMRASESDMKTVSALEAAVDSIFPLAKFVKQRNTQSELWLVMAELFSVGGLAVALRFLLKIYTSGFTVVRESESVLLRTVDKSTPLWWARLPAWFISRATRVDPRTTLAIAGALVAWAPRFGIAPYVTGAYVMTSVIAAFSEFVVDTPSALGPTATKSSFERINDFAIPLLILQHAASLGIAFWGAPTDISSPRYSDFILASLSFIWETLTALFSPKVVVGAAAIAASFKVNDRLGQGVLAMVSGVLGSVLGAKLSIDAVLNMFTKETDDVVVNYLAVTLDKLAVDVQSLASSPAVFLSGLFYLMYGRVTLNGGDFPALNNLRVVLTEMILTAYAVSILPGTDQWGAAFAHSNLIGGEVSDQDPVSIPRTILESVGLVSGQSPASSASVFGDRTLSDMTTGLLVLTVGSILVASTTRRVFNLTKFTPAEIPKTTVQRLIESSKSLVAPIAVAVLASELYGFGWESLSDLRHWISTASAVMILKDIRTPPQVVPGDQSPYAIAENLIQASSSALTSGFRGIDVQDIARRLNVISDAFTVARSNYEKSVGQVIAKPAATIEILPDSPDIDEKLVEWSADVQIMIDNGNPLSDSRIDTEVVSVQSFDISDAQKRRIEKALQSIKVMKDKEEKLSIMKGIVNLVEQWKKRT